MSRVVVGRAMSCLDVLSHLPCTFGSWLMLQALPHADRANWLAACWSGAWGNGTSLADFIDWVDFLALFTSLEASSD